MNLKIEIEQEEDGRFIADVIDFPGVLAYGNTRQEAVAKVQALTLRVLSDKLKCESGSNCSSTPSFIAGAIAGSAVTVSDLL